MNTLIALSVLAVLTLFLGIFDLKKWLLPVIVLGLLVSLGLNFADWGQVKHYYSNNFFTDNFSVAFGGVVILSTLVVFLMSVQYYKNENRSLEGIYSIILFSLAGGLIMISSANLVTFFIGLEIFSISLYLLAGSHKSSHFSTEAAMKYFLMGSFASAFLLFGIALLYGATGSLYNTDIANYINAHADNLPTLLKAGVILVAIGMAFKVAAAPFHFWAPDVYHGSPTLITAYMITTVKVAGFAAFLRLTQTCFGKDSLLWAQSLAAIAAISIIVGNLGGLMQPRIKRMLAYSSISHTGYILVALVALQTSTTAIFLYYSVAYIVSNLAAFLVVIMMKQTLGNTGFESFNGLSKTNPLIAFSMAIAMLALTGIPPLAGFMGKYLVFASAMQQGYSWLVIIAVLGSVVSIFYYFRPIINMYLKQPENNEKIVASKLSIAILVVLTLLSFAVGFIPGIIVNLSF
ncbi:MAG TPA: NADH-quinone oxidoreductase subunit N [Bacteroidales bacterium]